MRPDALRMKIRAPAAAGRQGVERYPRLRVAVVIIWTVFMFYSLYRLVEEPIEAVAGAMAIATAALAPAYLWADGYVPGLPVLPLHILSLLWAYALPLVAGVSEIALYDADDYLFASVSVALYAILATAVWAFVANRPLAARISFYLLPRNRGFSFLTGFIGLAAFFHVVTIGQLVAVDPGLFGIVRSSILAFASIAMFVLSLRLARDELTTFQRTVFLAAAVSYVVLQLASLYLVGSIVSVASALIGYTIGRGRVPWVTILSLLLVYGFLHSGKPEMREKYWEEGAPPIQLYELPAFFGEWIVAGAKELSSTEQRFGSQPIYERVSLMHMLLLAQRSAPRFVSYLDGETYAIVPRLLVPRLFDPDKPHSHQGTAMLNVHFGIQSPEDTERTTVGWGLLAEGFANFGLAGVAGVAVFLGLLFGYIGRLTAGVPVMSLETMIGVTFCAIAIQAEFTMGVFATVLFQSMVVLALVLPFLEKRRLGAVD